MSSSSLPEAAVLTRVADPPEVAPEPLPAAPAGADVLLGDALESVTAYGTWLADVGVRHGLIGPREVPRLWERHLLNCALPAALLPAGARVADVGSGAGLPGVVLALVRPDLTVDLVEPLLRRTTPLAEVVATLGLGERVQVVRARAQDHAATAAGRYDVVTARAVAALDVLAQWCLPLLRPGGELLALKGESAATELASTRQAIMRRGGRDCRLEIVGEDAPGGPVRVVRITRLLRSDR